MRKAQQVVEMVKQLTGLECEVEEGPCEGVNFADIGDRTWDCSKQGITRPHVEGMILCDRHNREMS